MTAEVQRRTGPACLKAPCGQPGGLRAPCEISPVASEAWGTSVARPQAQRLDSVALLSSLRGCGIVSVEGGGSA